MRNVRSTQPAKKATNLSLNSELLAEAKRLNINLSATMEKALAREVKAKLRDEWINQNTEAVESCNKFTEEHGLFSDSYRKF
ncbi:plasmid maintenance protein CcdB [Saccharobesus litoralis]|uniref:Plasmid maintenance protein CcdB n=1 Tax=Saccharobesus litoralis TaxID=2172099 RepID=A0A2S0VQA5_9ALTE|nr:type II toxin-antitoxin system CcdA family antitoxin [Saccharobesus litoralis]AWB66396.1 plasmid maintenance protein CcdB [Saccharobesus litoralis]